MADVSGSGSGSGYGYGSSDGSGYGYGSSDGYGDGSSDGSGDGYGSGSSSSDGSGYGYGSSDGYGSSSSDGSSSSYGDGDGYGSSDTHAAEAYWAIVATDHASRRPNDGAVVAIWRSDAKGFPANNGRLSHPAAPGVVEVSPGPVALCQPGTLHATWHPHKWKGERLWVVAMHPPLIIGEDKIGSLKREIICELTHDKGD